MVEERVKMRKQLGLLEGVAIILGIIFGSGIFISPKEVVEKTGSVWGALVVWAMCGVLATLGALSYAELGTTLAQSGGDYHYINEAYGPLPAFLYLWDANLVFVPSTNAIMALTFANNILQPIFPNCSIDPVCRKLIAAATICLLTFVNAYDVRLTTRAQNVFMFTKLAALLAVVGGGLAWVAAGGVEHFEDGWAGTRTSLSDWSVAFYSGIFSYSGWSYLNFMTEELREPFVNLPRAIYVSLPLVTGAYVLTNAAYLAVLGPARVRASDAIALDFAAAALGALRWAMPALVALAVLGGLSVHVMTSSRMSFAGARNGHLPALLAHVHVGRLSPLPSLVFLMLMSLLMLIPDNLTTLITYCTVVEAFFTTLSCSAVLWLRHKRPDLARPIRVPLWMPALFVSLSALLLLAPAASEPAAVLGGALITLCGVPVYYLLVAAEPALVRRASDAATRACQKLLLCAPEDRDD
ncbi:Y+L amino acid transporter 2-like isoform X2 [Bicyclus anynana]|uniref:Y+L amino acid transporter 2 isoform X1 n=1 Tax=Bicyclus anynana TaxID=110368 RepID=A0A6J1MSJ7_BICAN|nr:Y+L amino acid transporter 2 isoform X1 [Bicyclus anynana]XP_052746905.1 Y+L amino acid transporter 2-like isoform X2 [Bicyclus anynana]